MMCSLFSGYLHKRQSRVDAQENGQSLSEGSTFTYQDILDELISYTPHDPEIQSDTFRFSVSDGFYTQSGKVEFAKKLPRMDAPRLIVNSVLQLPAGIDRIRECSTRLWGEIVVVLKPK